MSYVMLFLVRIRCNLRSVLAVPLFHEYLQLFCTVNCHAPTSTRMHWDINLNF